MEITVHYTSQLRSAIGQSREVWTLEAPATLATLLELIAAGHAEAWSKLGVPSQHVWRNSVLVCVNDCQVRGLAEHELRPGDQVTLLMAISGG